MITTGPADNAVTRPDDDTVAVLGEELDQVSVFPLIGCPCASFGVAVSCVVCPTASDVLVPLTVIELAVATGACAIVRPIEPLLPSLVAVTVAVPTPTPVTRPDGETVSTAGLELDQAMVRPESWFPLASRSVTPRVCDWPTYIEVDVALSVTDATGCGAAVETTSVADPEMLSLVAMMLTDPAANAVTSPVLETVARAGAALVHVIVRPVNTLPDASRGTATACVTWPGFSVDALSVTAIDATGAGGGLSTPTFVLAVLPSTVAVTVAVPFETAVALPVLETVTTVGFELLHVGTRDASAAPVLSYAVAVN